VSTPLGRDGCKDEKFFTLANVGSTKLLWRVRLNSTARSMHNLFPPLIAASVATSQGSIEVGLVAGVTDDLFAVNVANGALLWRRRFENRLADQAPVDNVLCPGGQTAVPAMVQVSPGKYTVYAVSWDGTAASRSIWATARTSRRPRSSFPATASPMRSITGTA
jgi:hypothetical protein